MYMASRIQCSTRPTVRAATLLPLYGGNLTWCYQGSKIFDTVTDVKKANRERLKNKIHEVLVKNL